MYSGSKKNVEKQLKYFLGLKF